MRPAGRIPLFTLIMVLCCLAAATAQKPAGHDSADYLVTTGEIGRAGGRLVVAQRAEPKTLNPITALDNPSRDVIRCTTADLVHINRQTHKTEPALAKRWTVSRNGRSYVLQLRRGIKFSDGHPFDADDVVFSFQVYMDEKIHSPQRDLLIVAGMPLQVSKVDAYTVRFDVAEPYAAGERLFDMVAMLPRHLLEKPYLEGTLAQAWPLTASPEQIAGLGPFRLKKYTPGQSVVLERNPYYWKKDKQGNPLPYLQELSFVIVPNEDAQVLRFQAGEIDAISRLSAENFAALERDQKSRGYELIDAGPGLEYNFLLLNLNQDTGKFPGIARKQGWFRELRFRQALSAAIDREAIVRLVYKGRGAALSSHVTPGNKLWINSKLAAPDRDLGRARALLKAAGFMAGSNGALADAAGAPVEFSILVSATNQQRVQMATVIQQDLKELGIKVNVVSMEFRTMVDRITQSHDYEAAIMGLGTGDVDPTSEMNVWVSSGRTHLWTLGQKPSTEWEAELDRLMQRQMITLEYRERKALYDRVQQIVAESLPIIPLASPNILVGVRGGLGNFAPSILDHYTLSNVDQMFWRGPR
jgi:peptide/nickel transport system substrate-binding protein